MAWRDKVAWWARVWRPRVWRHALRWLHIAALRGTLLALADRAAALKARAVRSAQGCVNWLTSRSLLMRQPACAGAAAVDSLRAGQLQGVCHHGARPRGPQQGLLRAAWQLQPAHAGGGAEALPPEEPLQVSAWPHNASCIRARLLLAATQLLPAHTIRRAPCSAGQHSGGRTADRLHGICAVLKRCGSPQGAEVLPGAQVATSAHRPGARRGAAARAGRGHAERAAQGRPRAGVIFWAQLLRGCRCTALPMILTAGLGRQSLCREEVLAGCAAPQLAVHVAHVLGSSSCRACRCVHGSWRSSAASCVRLFPPSLRSGY